jgi:Cu(I)/Ag(I) efflux system membrane protein CusA/SilA
VGSFVRKPAKVVAETVKLPQGSYMEWSGQYENEIRARQRLQIVIPAVLAVIYPPSFDVPLIPGAAHVLLAVPFALSGYLSPVRPGVQHLGSGLGGLHRPLAQAVQTAVVMVIIWKSRCVSAMRLGGHLTREALLRR